MSDLVVIVYPSEEMAAEVRKRLFELQQESIITLEQNPIKLYHIRTRRSSFRIRRV